MFLLLYNLHLNVFPIIANNHKKRHQFRVHEMNQPHKQTSLPMVTQNSWYLAYITSPTSTRLLCGLSVPALCAPGLPINCCCWVLISDCAMAK